MNESQAKQAGVDQLINTLNVLENFGVKKSLKFEEIYRLCEATKEKIKSDDEQLNIPLEK